MRQTAVSESQTAHAQGGRQASLWELRSSPVPGETEIGVPESEVAAAVVGQQRRYEHTQSLREQVVCEREPLYTGQTAYLDDVSIARYDHTSITHED